MRWLWLPAALALCGCVQPPAQPPVPAPVPVSAPQELIEPVSSDTTAVKGRGGTRTGRWDTPNMAFEPSPVSPLLIPVGEQLAVLDAQSEPSELRGSFFNPPTNNANPVPDSGRLWSAAPAVAWTGTELLVIGGRTGHGLEQHAVAYNRADRSWRSLPSPPGYDPTGAADGPAAVGEPGVWTGSELVMWSAGLAFEPGEDAWREIAPYPGVRPAAAVTVWTGSEILVWGGCDAAVARCQDTGDALLADAAAYDPVIDTWRVVAPAPLAAGVHGSGDWTGTEVLVYAGLTDPDGAGNRLAAYDPAADRWRPLPAPPVDHRLITTAIWTGEELLLWGGSGDGSSADEGASFFPGLDLWRPLPAPPDEAGQGRTVAAWVAGHLYLAGGDGPGASPLVFTPLSDPAPNEDPEALDRRYETCVRGSGFDPGGVQVLTGVSGVPWWVKTGRDVPAGLHSECFAAIGGGPADHSSWGSRD